MRDAARYSSAWGQFAGLWLCASSWESSCVRHPGAASGSGSNPAHALLSSSSWAGAFFGASVRPEGFWARHYARLPVLRHLNGVAPGCGGARSRPWVFDAVTSFLRAVLLEPSLRFAERHRKDETAVLRRFDADLSAGRSVGGERPGTGRIIRCPLTYSEPKTGTGFAASHTGIPSSRRKAEPLNTSRRQISSSFPSRTSSILGYGRGLPHAKPFQPDKFAQILRIWEAAVATRASIDLDRSKP